MPGKTPDKEPVENGGYRGGKDIDMKDNDLKPKGKKSIKDNDDEMTVVVPPSKASKKSSAPPPNDADGDVAMDDSENAEEGAVKVDPIVQAINGTLSSCFHNPRLSQADNRPARRYQGQLRASRSCRRAL